MRVYVQKKSKTVYSKFVLCYEYGHEHVRYQPAVEDPQSQDAGSEPKGKRDQRSALREVVDSSVCHSVFAVF